MSTIHFYDHTRRLLAAGSIDMGQLAIMLLGEDAAFNPTDTAVAAVSAHEVSGNGWNTGGEPVPNATVETTATNEAALSADDIIVGATGGGIGPAWGAVVYANDGQNNYLLWFVDFDADSGKQAPEGFNFIIRWHDDGIAQWREPT